jgi:hypothetical protein
MPDNVPMEPLPAPSRTGVRVAGDMYQWLVAWQGCVTALQDRARQKTNPVVGVGVEVDDAGNLDDVVLYRTGAPDSYYQVKYAVDATTLVNTEYLLAPSRSNGPSILAKIAAAWRNLTVDGSKVDLALVTTRALDPEDPLTSKCDTRTSLLMPHAESGSSRSARGKARIRWAAAVSLSEGELLAMLSVLRFDTALTPQRLNNAVASQMRDIGLPDDATALSTGADWIARQVRDGRKRLMLAEIDDAVTTLWPQEQPTRPAGPNDSSEHGARRYDFADAALRGPIAELGLSQDLAEAEAAMGHNPAEAGALFGGIARALEASPYAPHAVGIRGKQAECLRRSGDEVGALDADLCVMSSSISAGDPGQAISIAHRLDGREIDGAAGLIRSVNALAAIAIYEHSDQRGLDEIAEVIDDLRPNDPYLAEAAALFAEHAIAARRSVLVTDRLTFLSDAANRTTADLGGHLLAARIRACIADATGHWDALVRSARKDYPPAITALLLARNARYLADNQQPEAAIERYQDAIERACQAGTYADAADWLYAIRSVRSYYGLRDGDLDDLHRLARAFLVTGNDSVIPEPFSARERALTRLLEDKKPDALEALRRYLWRAVVLASWTDEREAAERLGRLYAESGRQGDAIENLIRAGALKELEAVAGALPEDVLMLPVPRDLPEKPHWERACSFAIAGAAADLLGDQDSEEWISAALVEIERNQPTPPFTHNPVLEAFTAFGKLADVSTESQARRFLNVSDGLVAREPTKYRHTDDAHIAAIARIARSHPELRDMAVDQMCRALTEDSHMGQLVLARAGKVLAEEREIVSLICTDAAIAGNIHAAMALIISGGDTSALHTVAEDRLSAIQNLRTHQSEGQYYSHSYSGGWRDDAYLISILGEPACSTFTEKMSMIVIDQQDVAHNRNLALEAITSIAPYLDDRAIGAQFDVVIAAARGDYDNFGSESSSTNPFSRFQINFGPSGLRHSALIAAAALARNPDQYAEIVSLAQELMPHASSHEANSLAVALARLPHSEISIDIRMLAAHSNPWIRVLAAVIWCSTGGKPAELGPRLANDPSVNVRRSLAAHLSAIDDFDQTRNILASDARQSVRRALALPPN